MYITFDTHMCIPTVHVMHLLLAMLSSVIARVLMQAPAAKGCG